jgi:hypothetical protein
VRSARAWTFALCAGLAAIGCPSPAPVAPKQEPAMSLDDILERASSSDFAKYRPGPVVDAVNALHPLGKDGALAALDRFLAARDLDADPHQGLFLVLRVLFDVDADAHPPMRLGGSMPDTPPTPSSLPRFPIVLIDDLPILLISGYVLGGEPEPLSVHLDHYRQHGRLRARPLAPPVMAPAARMAKLEQLYRASYQRDLSGSEREFLQAQLATMP